MVGEEEVTFNSEYNELPPSKGELVPLKSKGNFQKRPYREWTYFIRDAEGIKIGRSIHPESRMRDLQGGNGSKLQLLVAVLSDRLSESAAHAKFQHLRTHREWFRPGQDLLDFIAELKAETAKPVRSEAQMELERVAKNLHRAVPSMPRGAKPFARNIIVLIEGAVYDRQPLGDHKLQDPRRLISCNWNGSNKQ